MVRGEFRVLREMQKSMERGKKMIARAYVYACFVCVCVKREGIDSERQERKENAREVYCTLQYKSKGRSWKFYTVIYYSDIITQT